MTNDATQTDDAEVTWTRTDTSQPPPRITYQASGGVMVTAGGSCSGGGSFAIMSAGAAFETYNFMPVGSAAYRSYKGQAYDPTTVNITCKGKPGTTFVGAWFLVPPPQAPQFQFFKAKPDDALTDSLANGGTTWT